MVGGVWLAAHLAAHWEDIAHWWRIRRYALRHADRLLTESRAYDVLQATIRRLTAEREALHREIEHLTAENAGQRRLLEEGDHNRISVFRVESLR